MQQINIKNIINFESSGTGTKFTVKTKDSGIYSKESYKSVSDKIRNAQTGGWSFIEVL